jgi:hypothetical protein
MVLHVVSGVQHIVGRMGMKPGQCPCLGKCPVCSARAARQQSKDMVQDTAGLPFNNLLQNGHVLASGMYKLALLESQQRMHELVAVATLGMLQIVADGSRLIIGPACDD